MGNIKNGPKEGKILVLTLDQFEQVMNDFQEIRDQLLEGLSAKTQQIRTEGENDLLTIDQVSEYLGVTKPTLHRWNKLGYLTRFHVGRKVRYRRADVERFSQASK